MFKYINIYVIYITYMYIYIYLYIYIHVYVNIYLCIHENNIPSHRLLQNVFFEIHALGHMTYDGYIYNIYNI